MGQSTEELLSANMIKALVFVALFCLAAGEADPVPEAEAEAQPWNNVGYVGGYSHGYGGYGVRYAGYGGAGYGYAAPSHGHAAWKRSAEPWGHGVRVGYSGGYGGYGGYTGG